MKRLSFIVAVLLFSTLFGFVSAEDITECRELNVSGTTYILQNNISTNETCFTITADNITLDGNGYIIDGDDSGNDVGIYANGFDGLTARDFSNITDFRWGVLLFLNSNNILTNITASSNWEDGFRLFSSSNNTLINLTSNSNVDSGISLDASSNNTLINIITNSNIEEGIMIDTGSNNTLTNITANSNQGGIQFDSAYGNFIYDMTSIGNSVYGVLFINGLNNTLYNFESYSNVFSEVGSTNWSATTGNTLSYNNSYGRIDFEALSADIEGTLRFGSGQNIEIGDNFAFVNSSGDISELNISANVTLRNTGINGTIGILKDGVTCSDCELLNSSGDTHKFNVSSWSNYSLTGCGDGVVNNGETCSSCLVDVGTCLAGGATTGASTTGGSGGYTEICEEWTVCLGGEKIQSCNDGTILKRRGCVVEEANESAPKEVPEKLILPPIVDSTGYGMIIKIILVLFAVLVIGGFYILGRYLGKSRLVESV
jgi:parallel beta-helix repeat protein